MSAGNRCAAYTREYRRRKLLEERNGSNAPKRTKLHTERQREYRKTHKNVSAEYMRNYRKRKSQENKTPQASTSTDPTPARYVQLKSSQSMLSKEFYWQSQIIVSDVQFSDPLKKLRPLLRIPGNTQTEVIFSNNIIYHSLDIVAC
jgi:hypothetical protein